MIEFTQYMRPNGRKELVNITRPDDIERLAESVKAKGGVFELEELMSGTVSMTIHLKDDADDPIAHEICANGPKVPLAVDTLIRSAYARLNESSS